MSRPSASVKYDNTGRVVIVTGGAQGIGLAIAAHFRDSGASVVVADVQAVDAAENVDWIHTDTASAESCQSCVDSTVEKFGALDVLVNNAAVQPPNAYLPIDELAIGQFDQMTAINFAGYSYMAKYALAVMKSQRKGVVINIASAQGHRTAREVGVYGPIKAANIMQARQWGVEYGRHGIRVVSVSPGAIDTPLFRAGLDSQGGERSLANRHPIGRIGKPAEIADAVMWLASDDASFITGTDLEVDGGLGAFAAFAGHG